MKLKTIIALAGLTGLVCACDDVIDLKPIDSFTDESYWTSVNDLRGYANRFYTNLGGADASGDVQSDNRVNSGPDAWLFDKYVLNDAKDWDWTNIRNLNFFMTRYSRVKATEADVNPEVAKVRFFRALDYFGKIKSYGDVPWYEEDLSTDSEQELFKDRDPRDFVLKKVIEDLEYAIQWLPDGAAGSCVLHKDAARAQLARVCLYYGTYKKYHGETGGELSGETLLRKAADLSEAIMNTGRYEIVKGDDKGASMEPEAGYPMDYQNQFVQEDLTANKEAILCRSYVAGVVTHGIGRSNGCGFSKDFAESFLCKDGKPIGLHTEYSDETLDKEMENRDPRMYQIIDNVHRPYQIFASGTKQFNHSINDDNASAPDVSASGSVTGYANVKWTSANPEQWTANASTFDWFIYRYAEVLLNYAEAKYELGECTQEVLDKTINQLRDRVGMPHLTVAVGFSDPNKLDYGYAVSDLLYEIRRERRIELVGEGFRYDDIIRWKAAKLFENPKTFLGMRVTPAVEALYQEGTFGGETGRALVEYEGKTYVRPYVNSLDDQGRKWADNDKRYLNPLSRNVLLINKNLKQNPGWPDK